MNPIWTQMIYKTVKDSMEVCTNCKRASAYSPKRPRQYCKCRFGGHRFQERRHPLTP